MSRDAGYAPMPNSIPQIPGQVPPPVQPQPQPQPQPHYADPYHLGPSPVPPAQPYFYSPQFGSTAAFGSYGRYGEEGGEPSSDRPPPLKRGDACLYCRKRRIRCSATKPSCHHCTKLRRECVYDVGKPISRVRKLENRVAELEGLLKGAHRAVAEANGRAAHAHAHAQARAAAAQANFTPSMGGQLHGVHDPNVSIGVGGVPPHGMPFGGAARFDQGPMAQPPATSQGLSTHPGQPSTAYSYPPGTLEQSTVDITMLDNFQPAPGMRTMAPRIGQPVPAFAPLQPVHVPPVPAPLSTAMPGPPQPQRHPQQPSQQPGEQMLPGSANFDWDTLDTQLMGVVNQMGETTTSGPTALHHQQPQEASNFHQTQSLPHSAPSSNPNVRKAHPDQDLERASSVARPVPYTQPNSGDAAVVLHPTSSGASSGMINIPVAAGDITGRVQGAYIDSDDDDDVEQEATGPALPSEWMKFDLVGGWYDPNDLPKQARDELLGQFFGDKYTNLGKGYNVPRFMARLDLAPSKRPHPCLLYAMYAMVARFSTAPKLKKLQDHFLNIANVHLQNAVKAVDRPFDATRAATLLTVLNYTLAHYQAANIMLGMAARLAFSCGLHQIPSSVFQPTHVPKEPGRSQLLGVMRSRAWLLFPPKDGTELGERIWAFWDLYTVDRTGAIGAQHPPSIPDYEVKTPFPRPLYEYDLGLTSIKDDYSLRSMYDDVNRPPPLPYEAEATITILYIRCLALLERASKLMYLPVEPGSPFDQFAHPTQYSTDQSADVSNSPINPPTSPSSGPSTNPFATPSGLSESVPTSQSHSHPVSTVSPSSSDIDGYLSYQNYAAEYMTMQDLAATRPSTASQMRCARLRTPKEYDKILGALRRLEEDLAPETRIQWGSWDGTPEPMADIQLTKQAVTLCFLRGCAWMFLFDVYSYQAENYEAVAVARRLAHVVKCLLPRHQKGSMVVDYDVFISMVWFFVSNILIREVKRLQALGDMRGASEVEADFNVVVEALKVFGKRFDLAMVQVKRAESVRQASLDDMEFMKGDAFDNDHAGRDVRDGKYVYV